MQLQMLGRDDVHGLKRLSTVVAHNDKTLVVKRCGGDVGTRGILHMLGNRGLHGVGVLNRERDQVATCQRIMLGLRHKIDGDKSRIGGFVSNDAHLGRTGDHIDSHIARNKLLRSGHERVARTRDLIDRGDLLGAIRKRGHSLSAAHAVDLGDTGKLGSLKHGGIKRAVLGGRVHDSDARHARNRSGNGVHQQRGGIQRATAGNVNAHGIDRANQGANDRAVRARLDPALLKLALMELANLRGGMFKSPRQLLWALGYSLIDLFLGNTKTLEVNAVELRRVLANSLVAALAHVLDDSGCSGQRLRVERALALQVLVGENLFLIQNNSTHSNTSSLYRRAVG